MKQIHQGTKMGDWVWRVLIAQQPPPLLPPPPIFCGGAWSLKPKPFSTWRLDKNVNEKPFKLQTEILAVQMLTFFISSYANAISRLFFSASQRELRDKKLEDL